MWKFLKRDTQALTKFWFLENEIRETSEDFPIATITLFSNCNNLQINIDGFKISQKDKRRHTQNSVKHLR